MKGAILNLTVITLILVSGCDKGPDLAVLSCPDAPFKPVGYSRQNTEVSKESFVSSTWGRPSVGASRLRYSVGHKSVITMHNGNVDDVNHKNNVVVMIDGRRVMTMMWWGALGRNYSDGSVSFGYPFATIKDKPPTSFYDEKTGVTVFEKSYRDLNSKECKFRFRISSMRDSKIKIDWESDNGTSPWISLSGDYIKNTPLLLNGKMFPRASHTEMSSKPNKDVHANLNGNIIDIAPDDRSKHITITFDKNCFQHCSLSEHVSKIQTVYNSSDKTDWRYEAMLRFGGPSEVKKGSCVIDLHEGADKQSDLPPPVGGIDFWAHDAIHIPLRASRNLLNNPSFEQGMRYWNWIGGGASYTPVTDETIRYWTTTGGYRGKKCLILRDTGYPKSGGPAGPRSMPYPTIAGKKYTFSFWAKAERNARVSVRLASASRGGMWKWYPPEPGFEWDVTKEWKRFHKTFTADGAGIIILISGGGNTLVDCLQFEEGDTPTEWTCEAMEGNLVTSDKDNDLKVGESINASFNVWGEKGKVAISVKNFYGEELYKTNLNIAPPVSIPLAFDTNKFGKGVFVVRADFTPDSSSKSFTDYYRFSIIDPLNNTHATKDLFGSLMIGTAASLTRGDYIVKKTAEWGFGSTTWGSTRDYNAEDSIRLKFSKLHNIKNFLRIVAYEHPQLNDYTQWTRVTPELEKLIEQVAYDTVRTNDSSFVYWAFGNEEEGCALLRAKKFDEYAKAQLACYRGVKRANPNAKVLPTCGTSGWSRLRGYEPMDGYLAAANKKGVKYDAIAVHPYTNVDGGILGKNDGDLLTADLLNLLDKHGYPSSTPIVYTEAWNVPETYVPEWEADECYDYYSNGKVSYDFGHREVLHAGSLARLFLTGLKYWPRLESINCWTSRGWIDQHLSPIAAMLAVNTLGHHFPDVEYYGEVKTYADVRGYVFKRKTDGKAVAAVWSTNHELERGRQDAHIFNVNFPKGVRVFDLMGNERRLMKHAKKSDISVLPVSFTPVIIEYDDAQSLLVALKGARSETALKWESVAKDDPNETAIKNNAISFERNVDWSKVPYAKGYDSMKVKFAWNWEKLLIRVEKDKVVGNGKLVLTFDCAADGRKNARNNEDSMNEDDYVYEFVPSPGLAAGRCSVERTKAVYHQLADGVNMATKKEVAEKVDCIFTPDGKGGGVYEFTLLLRYIEPIALREGYMAGCGIFFANPSKPSQWPLFVLKKK